MYACMVARMKGFIPIVFLASARSQKIVNSSRASLVAQLFIWARWRIGKAWRRAAYFDVLDSTRGSLYAFEIERTGMMV